MALAKADDLLAIAHLVRAHGVHGEISAIALAPPVLEPADLTEADIQWQMVDTYQAAARMAIKGEVDASFFLAEAYHSLSKLTKSQLKALMESKLADITHVLLTSAKVGADAERVKEALVGLTGTPDGQPVLDELGIAGGFEPMTQEDAEFMIDLMDTLLD